MKRPRYNPSVQTNGATPLPPGFFDPIMVPQYDDDTNDRGLNDQDVWRDPSPVQETDAALISRYSQNTNYVPGPTFVSPVSKQTEVNLRLKIDIIVKVSVINE